MKPNEFLKRHDLSRRAFIRSVSAAVPLVVAGCRVIPRTSGASGNFVTVRNGVFEKGGRPYRFIGANSFHAAMLGDPGLHGGRARLIRELDLLQSVGVRNLRILAASEGSPGPGGGRRGIIRHPGQWDEALLQGLDFALAEMARQILAAVVIVAWTLSFGVKMLIEAKSHHGQTQSTIQR